MNWDDCSVSASFIHWNPSMSRISMTDSFSRCCNIVPPLSLTSSIYSLSVDNTFSGWQQVISLHFPTKQNFTPRLLTNENKTWNRSTCCPLWAPASPQTPWWHSGVDLRQTPEGWLWFTEMPLFVSGEKRAGKPLQFLTESEEEEEKEEGRSARLVLSLSLCLCWGGVLFWGGDFNPPSTPSSSRTPWKPKPSVRIISIHLASSQVVELFIKAPIPINGCLEVVCWHSMAKGGKNRQ